MKDVGTVVRKAFYNALNNQVAVPGDPIAKVPIVDEKLDLNITETDLYMLIGEQSEDREATQIKGYKASETLITITIVNRRKATNSKTLVEQVSDDMLGIIFPTTNGFGISLDSAFNLSYVKTTGSEYSFGKTDDGFSIIKKTTFKTRITQK